MIIIAKLKLKQTWVNIVCESKRAKRDQQVAMHVCKSVFLLKSRTARVLSYHAWQEDPIPKLAVQCGISCASLYDYARTLQQPMTRLAPWGGQSALPLRILYKEPNSSKIPTVRNGVTKPD